MAENEQNPAAAVALHYDGDQAPTVLASGVADLAEEILDIARQHRIPVYENPELITLLTELSIGDEIPPDLYPIIAEVIAFAFLVQGRVPEGFQPESVSPYGPDDTSGPL